MHLSLTPRWHQQCETVLILSGNIAMSPSPPQSEVSKDVDLEKNDSSHTEKSSKNVSNDKESEKPADPKPPYCALSPHRRRFILIIVTTAGFFGPLAGNIYLPALPVLQRAFGVGATAINATVSSFMVVFAFAVGRNTEGLEELHG
jgi:hypothetical protein